HRRRSATSAHEYGARGRRLFPADRRGTRLSTRGVRAVSKTGAAVSTSTALPDEAPPVAAGPGRPWMGRLHGSGPALLIAAGVLIVWYAAALYSNFPFAQQIVEPHA